MQTLARNDSLGRTLRFSSTSLLWLAVAAPAVLAPAYAPPVLAQPAKDHTAVTKSAAGARIKVRRVGKNRIEVSIPGSDETLLEQTKRHIAALGTLEFAILANRRDHERMFDLDKAVRDPQKNVVIDKMTEDGAKLFADLTAASNPMRDGFTRRLAILLDDRILAAPSIRSTVHGTGIIEGNFTHAEVDDKIAILNAGALPARIKKDPLSEFTVVPRAGPKTAPPRKSP